MNERRHSSELPDRKPNSPEQGERRSSFLLQKFVDRFDELVARKGVSGALREMLEEKGYQIFTHYESDGTEKALEEEPSLVVGTHPNRTEALFTMATLPRRPDSKFLGNAFFDRMGPEFKEFLIPVFVSRAESRRQRIFRQAIGFDTQLSQDEARKKNKESIAEAVELIKIGGQLVIFPERDKEDASWYPGVGFIAKGLRETDSKIVFSHVRGDLGKWKAFGSLVYGANKLMDLNVEVFYSAPIAISELVEEGEEIDSRMLAGRIEGKYREWVESLEKSDKD